MQWNFKVYLCRGNSLDTLHVNAIPSMIVCMYLCAFVLLNSLNSTLPYYLGPDQAAANGGSAERQPHVTGNCPA